MVSQGRRSKLDSVTVTIDAESYARLLDIEQKTMELAELRKRNKYGMVIKKLRELAIFLGVEKPGDE